MADTKKQPFVFVDDDNQEYEFNAPDVQTALRAAREYAASKSTPEKKIRLTSTFDMPEEFVQQQEATGKWWAEKQREREAMERGGGGFIQCLAPLMLAQGLSTSAARTGAYAGSELLERLLGGSTKAPGTEGNKFLRDLTRYAPAAKVGGPVAGASSFAIGRLLDRFTDQTNAKPPGVGEVAAEVASNAVPGLKLFGRALQGGPGAALGTKGVAALEKHPFLAQLGAGAATGAAGTEGTSTDAGVGAGLGAVTGAAGYGAGKASQRILNALPALENPKVVGALRGLGYAPENERTDDELLQAMGQKLKKPAAAITELEKQETNVADQIAEEASRVTNARTLPIAQATNKKNAAFKVLREAREEEALTKLRAAKALKETAAEVKALEEQVRTTTATGGAKSAQEARLARAQMKLWTLQEGVARMNAGKGPDVAKATDDFSNAAQTDRRLRSAKAASQFDLADREARALAASTVYDRISESGFDPRTLGPNEKAAVKLLATEAPGHIIQQMEDDKAQAEIAIRGMSQLFGPKSPELAAVRNRFSHDLMEAAKGGGEGKFKGAALSGTQLSNFIKRFDSKTINTLFDKDGAADDLLLLANMLERSEKLRTPHHTLHLYVGPSTLGSAAGYLTGGSENATPGAAAGLAIGGTVIALWKNIPALMNDAVNHKGPIGKMIEAAAKNPNVGTGTLRTVAKVVPRMGADIRTKPEEKPAARP